MTENAKGPLLLIHGFPLDGRIWEKVTPAIRVPGLVVPDLPGHGKSPALKGTVSIDDYAREMLKIMDFQKIERFAVAGHSMGGYIAFALLRLAPQRISALALVSSRALPDSDDIKKTREATAQRAEKEGPGFLAGTMPERAVGSSPPPGVVDILRKIIREAQPKGVAADSRAMANRPDATPQLGSIQIPTLVLAGRGDKIVPAAESEAMANAIPGAKLVWCEKSGHVPMLEEPELVASELTALMK
jgi:pimeloyl-ACP methyl ester carboxylesterase